MKIFEKCGMIKNSNPKSAEAQAMIKDIKNYIHSLQTPTMSVFPRST